MRKVFYCVVYYDIGNSGGFADNFIVIADNKREARKMVNKEYDAAREHEGDEFELHEIKIMEIKQKKKRVITNLPGWEDL